MADAKSVGNGVVAEAEARPRKKGKAFSVYLLHEEIAELRSEVEAAAVDDGAVNVNAVCRAAIMERVRRMRARREREERQAEASRSAKSRRFNR